MCDAPSDPSPLEQILQKAGVSVELQRAGATALIRFSLSPATTGAVLAEVGGASEQPKVDALSLLLERDIPAALLRELEKEGAVRLLGQAQLSGETPEELLERFEPGEEFALSMVADIWPELPQLTRDDYFGLTLLLPRQELDVAKRDEAVLELRKRFPKEDGSLPEFDDELAGQVSPGLSADELSNLVNDRLKRESALAESGAVFAAMEGALLASVGMSIPDALIRERARAQYSERCRVAEEAALEGDVSQREALRKMLSWDAFEAFLSNERDRISRSLALSFIIEAIATAESLEIDQQAVTDNLFMYVNECKRNDRPVRDMDDPAFRESFEAEYMREAVLRLCVDHAAVEWIG